MTDRPAAFEGFSPDAIQFLADLAANNDRAWFQPRRAEYERLLKAPMASMIAVLADRLAARGVPLDADPVRSPFRIYRDTRFSKDKSPYKTQVSASFAWVGDGARDTGRSHAGPVHASGGYFHLEPGNIFVGGGVWHPAPTWLQAFRARVANRPDELRSIVGALEFVDAFGSISDEGESLKRVPPGYPPEHPAADLLRMKNVTFGRRMSDEEALSPELPTILADAFAIGAPLLRYLASI
jgi:uncharacterized protein (TIGR02453 family)